MYLKSISLRGFKSFAQRTEMQLDQGITVVIGPNGSGKSNVADAIKWALGEQSAGSLRAGSMEELIFAGSSSQEALGLAEVILTFDNTDRLFGLDNPEISIGRRLFRNGETHYLLNGSTCRLLDIQELLADARFGRGLTSIIGQGRIEEILISRPSERRAYIEEAAGVLKFRRRKERALRKLDKVEANEVRIKDVLTEVQRQLAPLERQAAKASQHREIAAQLELLETQIAVKELSALRRGWGACSDELQRIHDRRTQAESSFASAAEALAEAQSALDNQDAVRQVAEQHTRLFRATERLEGLRRLLEEKARSISARRVSSSAELTEAARRLDSLERRGADLGERLPTEEQSLQNSEDELKKLRSATASLAERLDRVRKEAAHQSRGAQEAEARSIVLRERFTRIEQERSRLHSQREDFVRITRGLDQELAELERSLVDNLEELQASQASETQAGEHLKAIARKAAELRERETSASQQADELRRQVASVEGRINALEELRRREDGAASTSLPDSMQQHVMGALAELIVAPAQYELAVERLMQSRLNSLVVRSADSAVAAIGHLKTSRGGCREFLALDLGSSTTATAGTSNTSDLTPLRDVLNVVDSADEFLLDLFDGVYVASELSEAIDKARSDPEARHRYFVTPDGEVVGPRGVLRGGLEPDERASPLSLRRELRHLNKELLEARGELDRSLQQIQGARAKLNDLTEAQEQANVALLEAQSTHRRFLDTEGASNRSLENRTAERNRMGEEVADVETRLAELETEDAAAGQEIAALEVQLAAGDKVSVDIGDRLSRLEAELEIQREAERDAVVEHRLHADRVERFKREQAELTEQIARAHQRLERVREDESRLRRSSERPLRLTETLDRLLNRARNDLEGWSSLREQAESRLRERESGLGQLRSTEREARDLVEELRRHAYDLELRKAELQLKVDALARRITEEQGVPLDRALALPALTLPESEARRVAGALRAKLAQLGPVNPIAVEELEELTKRRDFLAGQIADLEHSRRDLKKLVRQLDQRVREVFMDTFEAVSTNFGETVGLLFSGGKGRLSLTDGDLLEAGVEVQVQLSDKKFHSLSLLSGGERALAALAFVFALYLVKPAPFCVLDEVDAALDDFNLARFSALLQRFKAESQFLVVTHQKRTMESADILYGVSIRPDGSSTVVSQRVSDQAESVTA